MTRGTAGKTISGASSNLFGIIKEVVRRANNDECLEYAAAAAFYLLFALFLFLLFLVTLIAYLPTKGLLPAIMNWLDTFLPENAFRIVAATVRDVFTEKRQGLLSLAVAVSLYSSAQAMGALMTGLNRTLHLRDLRPWWQKIFVAVAAVVVFAAFVIGAGILLLLGPLVGAKVAHFFGFGDLFLSAWDLLRWPFLLLLLAFALSAMYRFLPAAAGHWHLVTPGSLTAILLWVGTTLLFSMYVNHFGTYNKMYGSIGSVIVLMVWMYINAFIILIGAEVDAVTRSRQD